MYISSAAFGMKCYTCSSNTSMDDCDKNRKETVCGPRHDRCLVTEFKFLVVDFKGYKKGCTTKAICDRLSSRVKQCKNGGGTCKAGCCDVDLCNSGAAPMISVLLLVACSLVASFPLSGLD